MPTELEYAALTAWTPAQQAALNHQRLAEQARKDEEEEEKAKEKAKEKKKEKDEHAIKAHEVTAETIINDLYIPALYEFLDIFGPPHIVLPVLLCMHLVAWYILPPFLSPILTLGATHGMPLVLALKSLYRPASALHQAYDAEKSAWTKTCGELKKKGKDKAEFPDPPKAPEEWRVTARDRSMWMAYWMAMALCEWLEDRLFGQDVWGLLWWPKIKAVACVAMYCVWHTAEDGTGTTGLMKLVNPWV